MLTWGARIRRIILVIVVLAVLGFLLSKVDWGKSSRYSVDNCACAHYAPMAAALPANPNGMSTDIATLDPARAQGDTSSMVVVSQLFDGLVTFDKDLNIEPWGAKSWTVSEDGFRSRSVNSWLLGERLRGLVRTTIASGRVAFSA